MRGKRSFTIDLGPTTTDSGPWHWLYTRQDLRYQDSSRSQRSDTSASVHGTGRRSSIHSPAPPTRSKSSESQNRLTDISDLSRGPTMLTHRGCSCETINSKASSHLPA